MMNRWFNGLFDRICAVIGALIFLQAPEFYQQYAQRLAGHIDELKVHIAAIYYAAEGRGIHEYIQKFLDQSDPDFIAQGNLMQLMLERQASMTNTLNSLRESTPFTRPYYFFKNLNWDVFEGTVRDYKMGLALTMEGLIYAIFGIVIGAALYHTVAWSCSRTFRSFPYFISRRK